MRSWAARRPLAPASQHPAPGVAVARVQRVQALRGDLGIRGQHGSLFGQSSFASHAPAKERGVVVVPSELPLDMLGPLGCGIQTGAGAVLNSLQPHAGSRLVIYGAGSVGLSAVMAAKLVGCHPIIAVEPLGNRRDLARVAGLPRFPRSRRCARRLGCPACIGTHENLSEAHGCVAVALPRPWGTRTTEGHGCSLNYVE